jgi:hypothetical protein
VLKHERKICLGAALLLILSIAAIAAPKMAIITVRSGSATLDGKAIVKASMASQGQMLDIATGSRVRIQLLGSNKELTVTGPAKIEIDRMGLAEKGKAVDRNSATVANDIGNKNTVSALSTRGKNKTLLDLRPKLPPRKNYVTRNYIIEFEAGVRFELKPDQRLFVRVEPADGDGRVFVREFDHDDPLDSLELPSDLEVGRGYRFTLIFSGGTKPYNYEQTFRILTQDQKAVLAEAKRELMRDYRSEKDILPLLRLASMYQELDQNHKVLEYLKMAYNNEHLNKAQWEKLRETIMEFESCINMPVPLKKPEN